MSNLVSINSKVTHLTSVAPNTDYERVLSDWLDTKRSEHTRRVYRKDITNFLRDLDLTLGHFFSLDRFAAFELVNRYRGQCLTNNLTAATINRRLAAVKSLTSHSYSCGHCEFTLETVKSERTSSYRDTTGIDCENFKCMLSVVDRSTFKGKRDYAILVLLWSNALRRSEVANATISDFDPIAGTLKIYGKGRGNQTELVSLGKGTISAISDWLEARAETNKEAALFCSANPGYRGGLSTYAIYKIVRETAAAAGINKIMSPHRIRHSSITAALDATNGDVRSVQKLSRHSSLNTLLIYDDNRQNAQSKVTNLLDGLI